MIMQSLRRQSDSYADYLIEECMNYDVQNFKRAALVASGVTEAVWTADLAWRHWTLTVG